MKRLFAVLFVFCLMIFAACDDGQEELMTTAENPGIEDTVAPTTLEMRASNCCWETTTPPYQVIVDGSTLSSNGFFLFIKFNETFNPDKTAINVYKVEGTLVPVNIVIGKAYESYSAIRFAPAILGGDGIWYETRWTPSTTYVFQGVVCDVSDNCVAYGPYTFHSNSSY